MSNTSNLENEITTNVGMGRSASSARFQIAKVSNNNHTNPEPSLGKAISIPNSMFIKEKKIYLIII
jgi:hypothetical protein